MNELDRTEVTTEAALEQVKMRDQLLEIQRLTQLDRERAIGDVNKFVGRIQVSNFFAKTGAIATLVFLKEVKDRKLYRENSGAGTWESFCNLIGMSRRKVDEDLQNLETFGQEFLATCCQLSLGYRDLRKLRKSITDGGIVIEENSIQIDGEEIPFTREHKDELQIAVGRILSDKDDLQIKLDREKKSREKDIHEATKDLKTEREALIRDNRRLKKFDPEGQSAKDITWCEEQAKEVWKACAIFVETCEGFILDERLKGDLHHQALAEQWITEARLSLARLERTWIDYFVPDDGVMG